MFNFVPENNKRRVMTITIIHERLTQIDITSSVMLGVDKDGNYHVFDKISKEDITGFIYFVID